MFVSFCPSSPSSGSQVRSTRLVRAWLRNSCAVIELLKPGRCEFHGNYILNGWGIDVGFRVWLISTDWVSFHPRTRLSRAFVELALPSLFKILQVRPRNEKLFLIMQNCIMTSYSFAPAPGTGVTWVILFGLKRCCPWGVTGKATTRSDPKLSSQQIIDTSIYLPRDPIVPNLLCN